MSKIEKNPGGSSSDNPKTNKVVKELQSAVNKLDPALRRVAFIGWPENMSAEKRVEMMHEFGKEKYKNFTPTDVGHDFTGPYNHRKLSTASWIEFPNCDTAKDFFKHIEKEDFKVDGTSIKIKFARTQFQKKRNYAMRKAEELLKGHPKTGSNVVTTEWKITDSKDRRILVNGVLAFSQAPYDGTGTFLSPFLDLCID